ncbi:MAG: DUF1848 domain-containing protein [Desulfovibrio sp.]|jgi:hypothetical protein|nr:DUF1848 domain-containing protein [Desulfovibrio sp.]
MCGCTRPLIISVSRATDIPAFYSDWLMARLRTGHCLWTNPFNARQKQRVSFERCKAIVFWSKNPLPLLPYLREISAMGFVFYVQFTLNDYEVEGLEPGLPPLRERLETFCRLSGMTGRERVIWRYDPLLLGRDLPVDVLLRRIDGIGRVVSRHTEKLVFSFLDQYRKTGKRLREHPAKPRSPSEGEMRALAEGLAACNASWPHPLQLSTCAEIADYADLGIAHNACVDVALIRRLCRDAPDCDAALFSGEAVKDAGQRKACGCFPSKDIGAYNTCPHGCAYCYANR